MITIRERSASGGVRYEVLVRVPGQPTVKRMFRRLSEAKMWAHQQAQHLQPGVAVTSKNDPVTRKG